MPNPSTNQRIRIDDDEVEKDEVEPMFGPNFVFIILPLLRDSWHLATSFYSRVHRRGPSREFNVTTCS